MGLLIFLLELDERINIIFVFCGKYKLSLALSPETEEIS